MQIKFNAFGLTLAAGYDAAERETAQIERAARKMVAAEERNIQVQAMAERVREQNEERRKAVLARAAEIRAQSATATEETAQ